MIPYVHGGDVYRNLVELDYSTNINPLGLPVGVKKALAQSIDQCSQYPDSRAQALGRALALRHQVEEEDVICANGAADLIFQVVQARRPKSAFLLAPTFAGYHQALKAWGAKVMSYSLSREEGFQVDMDRLLSHLKALAQAGPVDMAFFCNPNNPTGLAVPKAQMVPLLEFAKARGIFLVADECFCDFLDVPEDYTLMGETSRYPNLLILKAFTKLYAMAGIRLGYGICHDRAMADGIQMVRQPWSVSCLAQAAGVAALKEGDYVARSKRLIAKERPFLKKHLEGLGFFVFPSMANYLFFQDLEGGRDLYSRLLERKVLIRDCSNYPGLEKGYYRISVKTREENLAFLKLLKAAL